MMADKSPKAKSPGNSDCRTNIKNVPFLTILFLANKPFFVSACIVVPLSIIIYVVKSSLSYCDTILIVIIIIWLTRRPVEVPGQLLSVTPPPFVFNVSIR